MWLWDCRGSHQHFEKHVAWLLSTNWDVNLGGWKPFFSWNTLIPKDMDLIWRALLLPMFFSNLVGWKKHQLKNWIAVSSTCDQRGSFRPFFVQRCQQFTLMVSLIGLMMSCSCSEKIFANDPSFLPKPQIRKISQPGPFRNVHFVWSHCFWRRKHVMRDSQLLPVSSNNFSQQEVEERCVAWQYFAFLWTSQVGSTAEAEWIQWWIGRLGPKSVYFWWVFLGVVKIEKCGFGGFVWRPKMV